MSFRLFSKACIGPKYKRKGWNCQDYSDCRSMTVGSDLIVVADGHGSSDCFRSAIGSRLAYTAVVDTLSEYLRLNSNETNEEDDTPIELTDRTINNFKFSVAQRWRELVKEDWDSALKHSDGILGANELRFKSVSEKYRARYTSDDPETVERYLYTAYGTTLILAATVGEKLLLLQIGDGSCVVLRRDGKYIMPIPADDENYMNVTVSLCEENANTKMRTAVLNCSPDYPESPAAVFLTTDGFDDCYPVYNNNDYLYKVYSGILSGIIASGFDEIEAEIADSLLPEMTSKSSLDDISLAYMIDDNIKTLDYIYDLIIPANKPAN
jgi:serine/threonine protein phosphatase PrpC